ELRPPLSPHGPVREDRRRHGDDPVSRQQRRDPADPADVRVAVGLREPEAGRQVLAHLVAVQKLDAVPPPSQLVDDGGGDRALPGSRQPGEPQAEARARHEWKLPEGQHRYGILVRRWSSVWATRAASSVFTPRASRWPTSPTWASSPCSTEGRSRPASPSATARPSPSSRTWAS